MGTFRVLTDTELKFAYKKVLKEAFPSSELKPLRSIRVMVKKGIYDTLGLFEEGEPIGYVFLWRDEPEESHFVLMDYLCVPDDVRNGGIGGRLVEAARAYYPEDYVFIAEAEAPTGDPEKDALILRRLGFYERNGARIAGYDTALFGVHYKTVVWAKSEVSDEKVLNRHDGIYRRHMGGIIYDKFIQIPLREGEKPRPYSIWTQ